MTDFSAHIRAGLLATQPNRETFARNCVAEFDRNGDGAIGGAEFLKVFASLQRADEAAGSGQTTYMSAGIRPTIFDCTLFPAFSRNFAISAYQANAMVETYDRDGDQSVTLDELLYVTPVDDGTTSSPVESPTDTTASSNEPPPPTPPTAEERADDLLTLYDKQAKGYIDISDIISAWVNDPSLGDVSQAGNAIAVWDRNGDEKVTRDELIAGYRDLDAANALLTALADPTTGTIKLADVNDSQLSTLGLTRDQLNAWDADTNGDVTRTEVLNALRKVNAATAPTAEMIAQALMTRFDQDKSGTLSLDEFTQTLASYQLDAAQAQDNFAAWDLDRNNEISSAELATGIKAIQDAQAQVAVFDTDGKGYFTLQDLQRAIAADPSSTSASADDLMTWWDVNGDGMVTPQDVIARKNLDATQAANAG